MPRQASRQRVCSPTRHAASAERVAPGAVDADEAAGGPLWTARFGAHAANDPDTARSRTHDDATSAARGAGGQDMLRALYRESAPSRARDQTENRYRMPRPATRVWETAGKPTSAMARRMKPITEYSRLT